MKRLILVIILSFQIERFFSINQLLGAISKKLTSVSETTSKNTLENKKKNNNKIKNVIKSIWYIYTGFPFYLGFTPGYFSKTRVDRKKRTLDSELSLENTLENKIIYFRTLLNSSIS